MPILSNCCFCFDLKVGSKIIGIIALIGALINTLAFTGVTIMFAWTDQAVQAIKTGHRDIVARTQPEDDYADGNKVAEGLLEVLANFVTSFAIIVYVMLALAILLVITSSCLIHGIKHNRRHLLLPFIGQQLVNVIVVVICDIWVLAVIGTHQTLVAVALGQIGYVLVHLYFGLVVFSQYQALGVIRMHEENAMK